MRIVHVVPIERGVFRETFSYFTAYDIPRNSLVKIPIRGKFVFGLVTETEDASSAKSKIKSSAYPLKKISRVSQGFLLPEFLKAASLTARYFAVTTGSILSSLVHEKIIDEYFREKSAFWHKENQAAQTKNQEDIERNTLNLKSQNQFVLQEGAISRYAAYRTMIREQFAAHSSIFLIVPRISDAEKIYRELSRGIEEYSFLFHSRLAWTKLRREWVRGEGLQHPALFIGTPMMLALPRCDIGLFIIEEESALYYRSFSRPFFDIRYFTEAFALELGVKLVLGSSFLSIETLQRYKDRELIAHEPLRSRIIKDAIRKVIDIKKECTASDGTAYSKDIEKSEGEFRIISSALERAIKEQQNVQNSGNVFLYGVRRGLSTETVCRDCGNIVMCRNCSSPSVLHRGIGESENIFLCHKCGARRSAMERCISCESWRLVPLGIGIESVAEEARKLFPRATIFELHSDSVKTAKEAQNIADSFASSQRGILIGTEKALPYLSEVAISGILSLDSLFLIPDFRIRERTLRTIFEIYEKTTNALLIQTRRPEEAIFSSVLRGDIMDFYKSEICEREKWNYPPFSVLIKISWSGKDDEIRIKSERIRTLFAAWSPRIFPAFIQKIKNRLRAVALIKVEDRIWPDQSILRILFSLTPDFQIEVDPVDLL